MIRRGKIASALMVALALLLLAGGAAQARESSFAPASAEKTLKGLSWLCMLRMFCPLTPARYDTFKRSVEGHRDDQYYLGLLLRTGDGFPSDRDAGMQWIVIAAEKGAALAVMFIESRMQNGEHFEFDETKAATLLQKDVAAGDIDAMRALGPMTIRGRGVAQNPQAGLALLRQAADRGSIAAARDLAHLYTLGTDGLPRDHDEGMRWYTVAASHGDVDSMVTLGSMWRNAPMADVLDALEKGQIPRQRFQPDIVQGYCWLVRAAMLGSASSQYELALFRSRDESDNRGNAIALDYIQADFWFRLGARNREYDNSQVRGGIEPKMTTAQMDEAKKLVDAWHTLTSAGEGGEDRRAGRERTHLPADRVALTSACCVSRNRSPPA
jgi:TPR repeat protein